MVGVWEEGARLVDAVLNINQPVQVDKEFGELDPDVSLSMKSDRGAISRTIYYLYPEGGKGEKGLARRRKYPASGTIRHS